MHLFKEGLKGEMVKNYMVVVRHSLINLGLGDAQMSEMPQLGYVIRGITKGPLRTRLPIAPDVLMVQCNMVSFVRLERGYAVGGSMHMLLHSCDTGRL